MITERSLSIRLDDQQLKTMQQDQQLYGSLSHAELRVAELALDGFTDEQIACRIGKRRRTVSNHIHNITAKARRVYASEDIAFRSHVAPRLYCMRFLTKHRSET